MPDFFINDDVPWQTVADDRPPAKRSAARSTMNDHSGSETF